ncbi:hypothetical protein ACN42_g10952, partial [Penicillium freii]
MFNTPYNTMTENNHRK